MITTNCTYSDPQYYTGGAVVTLGGGAKDNIPFTYKTLTCTDDQLQYATPSASGATGTVDINFATGAGEAMHGLTYIVWMGDIVLIAAVAIITFFLIMRRR